MPRFVYKPEGADPQSWDFAFSKLLSPERIIIEKMTGLGWDDVQRRFFANQTDVVHALLYVFLKRGEPTLAPEHVVFCDDDFDLDLTDDEVREHAERLAAKPTLDADEAEALAAFRERLGEESPKAEAPSTSEPEPAT